MGVGLKGPPYCRFLEQAGDDRLIDRVLPGPIRWGTRGVGKSQKCQCMLIVTCCVHKLFSKRTKKQSAKNGLVWRKKHKILESRNLKLYRDFFTSTARNKCAKSFEDRDANKKLSVISPQTYLFQML